MATSLTVQDCYQEIIPDPIEDDDDESYHPDQDENSDDDDYDDYGSDNDDNDNPKNSQEVPANDPMIPVDLLTPEEPALPPNVENEFPLPVLDGTEDEHIEPNGVPIVNNDPVYVEPPMADDMPMDPQDPDLFVLIEPPVNPTINPQLTHKLHQLETDGDVPLVLQACTHSGHVFNILDHDISNEFECLDEDMLIGLIMTQYHVKKVSRSLGIRG